MEYRTCATNGCDRSPRARGLCAHHYGIEYRAGSLLPIDRGPQHRISSADTAAQTGVCSICGPVRIRVRRGRGHQCWTLRLQERRVRTRKASPDVQRASRLRQKYGITAEDYDRMLDTQGGVCAICGGAEPTGRRLAVDHDHATGVVRQLLCKPCNVSIGSMGEDVDRLRAAIAYIEAHQIAS